jgi:hypothetical protein
MRRLGRIAFASAAVLLGWFGVADASGSPAPIRVSLSLVHHRVAAGQTIKGTVVLTNGSSRSILVNTCAEDGWLEVGLKGHGYTFEETSSLVACKPTVRLKPGANRFPVVVLTSYETCQQPPEAPSRALPACVSTGSSATELPPLPVGTYSTTVYITGLSHLTQTPNRLEVTLEPTEH